MAQIQQQNLEQQQPQWQPKYDAAQTKKLTKLYKETPHKFTEEQLQEIRDHAGYHQMPFYEGEFSIFDALKQAGGGFLEGFTTLRVADHPDNEYEAVARSVGHLAGFVPGILSGPLKALGLMRAARAVKGVKSLPMIGADYVTKKAKKIVKPILKGASASRFKAADDASSFFLGDKVKHLAEGAFHLGTASAISSVWDGVDQMWESFKGGAVAGGVFRTIGNVIPGTTSGDKFIKGLAGSMFMGLPTTMRGATTPEQIYEYLAGAYFGANERPWYVAKANKGIKEFTKEAEKNPQLEWERNVEKWDKFEDYPDIVQREMVRQGKAAWGSRKGNLNRANFLMELHGITDKIPAEQLDKRYEALNSVMKGQQKRTKYKAVDKIGVGVSSGGRGAPSEWGKIGDKYGFPVIHMIPETEVNTKGMSYFIERIKKGKVRGVQRGVTESELLTAGQAVEQANNTLKIDLNKVKRDTYEHILNNWMQIKNSGSVYAIGELNTSGDNAYRTLNRGGAWGMQMALDKGMQKAFVFDQKQRSWFQWSADANRFKAIDGVPKLGENPALLGDYKLQPSGVKAIRDVYEKSFGQLKTGEKSPLPDAVDPSTIREYHVETVKNIRTLREAISEKKQDISDINTSLKQGVDKVRVKELNKQKKELQKQIDGIYKEIVEAHQTLQPTQYIDMNTGQIITDVDTGMKSQEFALMKKSEHFANRYLKDIWDAQTGGLISKRDKMVELGKDAETIIRNHIEKGNKNIKVDDAVKDMEQAFGINLKPEAVNHIRKWLRELNLGKQVVFLKTRGGKEIDFSDPSHPTDITGQIIRQVESPKMIEEIFDIEGGTYTKSEKVQTPLVVWDSVGRSGKTGLTTNVPLDKLVMHLRFTENLTEADAIQKADNLKGNIIKKMLKEENMMPLGGQGDKGRLIFVKLHPKARKPEDVRLSYTQLLRALRQRKDSKGKLTDKDAITLFNKDMEIAKTKYGITNKEFKQMVASNVRYDLAMNGFKYSYDNIKKLMHKGFINSAIAFNKRNQIWMTNGYGGNKEFFKHVVDANGKTISGISDLSPRDNFIYRLIDDPSTPDALKKKALKALSTDLPEHVDGAILVRSDVIEAINADAGHPSSGQNKSFIVDKTPLYKPTSVQMINGKPAIVKGKEVEMGALLGKYMMHDVGETASKAMFDKGVHMLVMTSAAKQTGGRKIGNYSVGKNGELFLNKGADYELDPGSIKYNSSVINDSHMAQKQIWVKQLFTNLHQYGHAPISTDIINEIHRDVIRKNFEGDPNLNKQLEAYKNSLDPNKIENLLQNLESLGTKELIEVLKTPGAERFAEQAMQRMLRIVEKDIEMQFQEGDITAEERAASLQSIAEAVSPIDRLLKNVAIVGEEANQKGLSGYSGYMHKYVRDYRAAVLHNYFVKSVTRPIADNSAVARIRPYDKWMQKKFPELNKDDNSFMLDSAYKETKIKLPDGSEKTLGELWKLKNNPKYKRDVKNVFNALVLRVPMDSISGAHKLEFKGFTGRKGHGILMHSRTMRAIGGADLDGDEAFVYFGGKRADGTGHGMKQSWLDAIHANRGEFYNKSKTDVKDNKDAFRDLLTEGAAPDNPLKQKKSLYYSPISRIAASEGAVQGRGMLGIAVSQGQVMKSAYNALMAAEGQQDVFKTSIKGDGTYRVTLTPKTKKKEREYQRELTRAQIAFASDPLDEAGLKSPEVFFNTMHNAYFKTSFEKWNKKLKKYEPSKAPEKLKPTHLKRGLVGNFKNMNSAYFGRNYDENRRYTMDEVNHLASNIRFLTEAQKNTILPKMVETLEGLDWSDNMFNRIDRAGLMRAYEEIDAMVKDPDGKFGNWLKGAMARSSFRVPYNKHIKAVINNELYDRTVRHRLANDESIEGLRKFRDITINSMFGAEFNTKAGRMAKLYDYKERIKILEQMHRQAEDFLSNDIATMATLMNIKRILENNRIHPKVIRNIHRKVEQFKMQSYLNKKDRRALDYNALLGSPEEIQAQEAVLKQEASFAAREGRKIKKKDLGGDTRSATYDQVQLDMRIKEYKKDLNKAEQELFDHLFIGTLNRGEIGKIKKYMDMQPKGKRSPILRDLISKLLNDAAKTRQTRLAFNSEAISDIAIQNHFKSMNNVHGRMWEPLSEKDANTIYEKAGETIRTEPKIVDELVQGAHKGTGYAGIKKGEITAEDKAIITKIATILKKYNNKLGNNIPDLNEQIRGITAKLDPDMRGKDLNALHKQDFKNILRYLEDVESGTMWQRIWNSSKPELQKRYYSMFPETLNRELMAHDIKWLRQKGWFIEAGGGIKEGYIRKPTYFMNMLQNIITKNNGMATAKAEGLAKEIEAEFNHLQEIKEGNGLFDIAVAQMELGNKDYIDKLEEPGSIKKHYKLIYDKLYADKVKEHNWKKLKNKEFIVLNNEGKRVKATGFEIVNGSMDKNLNGIKKRISTKFEEMHKLIVGDKKAFNKYKTGKYFDPDTRLQPKMNWEKFVTDMQKALEKGDTIPMELGIDGMRHIMRSMMVDLSGPKKAAKYSAWVIKNTQKIPYGQYWPHMFYDRASAEKSIKRALEFIRKDSSLNDKQRKAAIAKIALRQKTVTGDWEVQDMQDWDKVDVLDMQAGRESIAAKKKIDKSQVKWTDMNPTFGSMFSRKGHIEGWSTDMNVMQSYAKNLANTYYRQISHLMSRQVLDQAYKRLYKKFGDKGLAERWDRFFKLYVQGAMGQPDVIPERWYEDPLMKMKGTPYAWWADNHVLERVNKIREKLGIREGDLPKELKDFDYNDIRHWSNMEAKFELASLLAHPKSAITNIFGGSLHTIQSAGPGALRKARSIKWLKRINPNWNSMQDVQDFVVSKGVLPEFMIHELGLGKNVKGDVSGFVGELSNQINSTEGIKMSDIRTIGKKYKLSDAVMSKASKFMSVPERTLRRDAFMSHYVRAWERFGGAITDPNHPFLIETAKKGVKATQFLYEAPQRPLFARTALGKVMTRFQLYAWNSVRFRKDVIRNAKLYGFKPGTEAYDRFVRTAQIDLFVLALGNMFAYSLFDNALPQPWSWFQDTAEWLFGDEREREKAFFGTFPKAIAPLQIVAPPISRFPVSGLMQWARDDYTKFTDYQMYTALPFGRIVRDIFQPDQGLIDNPGRFLEKMAGMPMRDIQRFTAKRKKDIEEGKRFKQPKVGY